MAYIGNQLESSEFVLDLFVGDGSTTIFTMSEVPSSKNSILVTLNGIKTTDFIASGNILTFDISPLNAVEIEILHLGIRRSINHISPESVDADKIDSSDIVAIRTKINVQAHDADLDTVASVGIGTGANQIVQRDVNGDIVGTIIKNISYISKSGHNNFFFMIDGVPYSTSGNAFQNGASVTGRGLKNTTFNYGPALMSEIPIPSTSPVVKLGGGCWSYAYALLENGELYTWGSNTHGQCGLGHTTPVGFPTLSQTGVTDVYDHPSNGEYNVNFNKLIIRKTDGFLYGAGYNLNGNLGDGTITDRSSFVQLTGFGNNILNAWNLGCHLGCTVVQRTDHTIWVAGYGVRGALGTGANLSVSTPADVTAAWNGGAGYILTQASFSGAALTTAEFIANTMAMLLDNGTTTRLSLSGENQHGQIGDGTTTARNTPILISPEASRIKEIAYSRGLTIQCLYENNNLYAWGHGNNGLLGSGGTPNAITPLLINNDTVKLFCDGIATHKSGDSVQYFIKKTDGNVYGTGVNGFSVSIGSGSQGSSPILSYTKTKLPEDFDCTDIGHMCTFQGGRIFVAINAKGEMYAWGFNAQNGVRATNTSHAYIPEKVNY